MSAEEKEFITEASVVSGVNGLRTKPTKEYCHAVSRFWCLYNNPVNPNQRERLENFVPMVTEETIIRWGRGEIQEDSARNFGAPENLELALAGLGTVLSAETQSHLDQHLDAVRAMLTEQNQ